MFISSSAGKLSKSEAEALLKLKEKLRGLFEQLDSEGCGRQDLKHMVAKNVEASPANFSINAANVPEVHPPEVQPACIFNTPRGSVASDDPEIIAELWNEKPKKKKKKKHQRKKSAKHVAEIDGSNLRPLPACFLPVEPEINSDEEFWEENHSRKFKKSSVKKSKTDLQFLQTQTPKREDKYKRQIPVGGVSSCVALPPIGGARVTSYSPNSSATLNSDLLKGFGKGHARLTSPSPTKLEKGKRKQRYHRNKY